MKIVDKIDAFIFFILFSVMIGFVAFHITKSGFQNTNTSVNNEYNQNFPIRLSKEYEVISVDLSDDLLTITIRDRFTGSEYKSSYPYETLKNRICGGYVYRKSYWDCSDENKILKSSILELGYKSLKMI